MSFDYTSSFFQGGHWANKVAERLNHAGVQCYAPPITIAKTREERNEMTKHEKDIVFSWTQMPLEVKSSSRIFGDDIMEYPHDTLFVDTVNGYDSKMVPPISYVIVSQQGEGMVCISPKSKPLWEKVKAFDRHREIYDEFYSAPKEVLMPFASLVDHLRVQAAEATRL